MQVETCKCSGNESGQHEADRSLSDQRADLRMSAAVSSVCRRTRTGNPRAAATCCMTASKSPKYSTEMRCAKRLRPDSDGASSGNLRSALASLIGAPAN